MSEQTSEKEPQFIGRLSLVGGWLAELLRPKKPESAEKVESLFSVDLVARQIGTNIYDFASDPRNGEFVTISRDANGHENLEVTKYIQKEQPDELDKLQAVLAYPDPQNVFSFNKISIVRQRVQLNGAELAAKDNHSFQFVNDDGTWQPSSIEFESVTSPPDDWHEDHRLAAMWLMVELFHETGSGELPGSAKQFSIG